jgi:hypothetical protein
MVSIPVFSFKNAGHLNKKPLAKRTLEREEEMLPLPKPQKNS